MCFSKQVARRSHLGAELLHQLMRVVQVAASLHGVSALVENKLHVGLQLEESALERVDVDPGALRLGLLAAGLGWGRLGRYLHDNVCCT